MAMVEFINRLTESQASDKVHKVLRSDPDKKRNQPEQEESELEKKEERDEPKDEAVISSAGENQNIQKGLHVLVPPAEVNAEELKNDKQETDSADGHIDVTA